AATLRASGIRVEIDASDESLGNRVRKAQVSKVPYMVVVGDKEAEAATLSVRPRGGEERRGVSLDEFIADITAEIADRGSPEQSRG
ncbi:MAG TPA: His/Gly/Thr/Pro-type tRNA ligase C-terminal domain-containing protein, partial [Actinomycetota bacterium]|nr:His/Gly/Thr/Pro-type tRNA ligase C-terminal domain-containing protein [Actinomycetota bacterium]